jgi:hypothetical protein
MKDDNIDDDSSSNASSHSDGSPRLTPQTGLSADAFAALLEFQQHGSCFDGDQDDTAVIIPKEAVCATFTAADSQVIAATYKRLKEKEEELARKHEIALQRRVILDLVASESNLADVLLTEGVVRVDQVLGSALCNECLKQINESLVQSEHAEGSVSVNGDGSSSSYGFGNVFSRKNRFDMYIDNTGVFEQALVSMLGPGTVLGELFETLLEGRPGIFHELSSLISDPGSASQCIHPDSPYAENAPMWTVFVALQDISADMGPTVFLPRTNGPESREKLESPKEKDGLLANAEYRQATLCTGDCAVMDSRTFHFGNANESETRRVLLYITIRNPKHTGDFPACGSIFPHLDQKLTTCDYRR